ncbi:hypothetical protein [Thermus islandicus]|uniref:hypothetical protein n=1 Tax=Thermus islandicus TaxID=540988 RepID=UPI0003B2F34A|nr:hypothetical protein [Thermus islandicus]
MQYSGQVWPAPEQAEADWVASANLARRALAQGAGSEGLGHGQLALMLGNRLTHLRLLAS